MLWWCYDCVMVMVRWCYGDACYSGVPTDLAHRRASKADWQNQGHDKAPGTYVTDAVVLWMSFDNCKQLTHRPRHFYRSLLCCGGLRRFGSSLMKQTHWYTRTGTNTYIYIYTAHIFHTLMQQHTHTAYTLCTHTTHTHINTHSQKTPYTSILLHTATSSSTTVISYHLL